MYFSNPLFFLTALLTTGAFASPVALPSDSLSTEAISIPVPAAADASLLQKRKYVPEIGQCKIEAGNPSIRLVGSSWKLDKLCACLLPKPYLAQPMVPYGNHCTLAHSGGTALHAKLQTPKLDSEYFGESGVWLTKETCKSMLAKAVVKCSKERGGQLFKGWVEVAARDDQVVVDWVLPVRYWFSIGTVNK